MPEQLERSNVNYANNYGPLDAAVWEFQFSGNRFAGYPFEINTHVRLQRLAPQLGGKRWL